MTRSKFAALAGTLNADPEPAPVEPAAPAPAPAPAPRPPPDLKKLTARVPLDVFQEFAQHRLDAERTLKLRRVTTEAAVEALLRLLRDPDTLGLWQQEVAKVVEEQG